MRGNFFYPLCRIHSSSMEVMITTVSSDDGMSLPSNIGICIGSMITGALMGKGLGVAFFAAGFLAAGFLAAGFFAAGFFATTFFGAAFFAGVDFLATFF